MQFMGSTHIVTLFIYFGEDFRERKGGREGGGT